MSADRPRSTRSWRLRAATLALAAVTAGITGAQSAAAATASSGLVTAGGDYCAFNSATGALACVDDQADYDSARRAAGVTGDPAGDAGGTIGEQQGAAADNGDNGSQNKDPGRRTQYLLGRFYDNAQYSTSAGFIDWFAPAACTSSTSDIDSSWFDTSSWRSRISSFQGYSNCLVKVYENTGYGGAHLGYSAGVGNVGVLNNHIWSVRFS